MKERDDLIKMKELCEKILSQTPDNAAIKEKMDTVNKKLKYMERRFGDKSAGKEAVKPKDKTKTHYL